MTEKIFNEDTPLTKDLFLGTHKFKNLTIHREYLKINDILSIHHTTLTPINPPKASIIVIHGFGEHS